MRGPARRLAWLRCGRSLARLYSLAATCRPRCVWLSFLGFHAPSGSRGPSRGGRPAPEGPRDPSSSSNCGRHRHKLQFESSLLLRTPPARGLLGREQGTPGRSRDGYPQIAQRPGACAHPRCSLAGVFRRLLGVPSTSGLVDWSSGESTFPYPLAGRVLERDAWPGPQGQKHSNS